MADPTVGSAVATKVFGDILSALAKSVLASAGKQLYDLLTKKGSSLRAHVEATFERCTKIKTLLARDEPVDLLSQYVNLKFTSKDKMFDDYDVIEELRNRKRIVISGTGGGGKTIFMKYLWIALFENPQGKIPLFVELRRLNEGTNDRLDLYIYHSIIDTQATLAQSEFEKGLKEGRFVLVLDGFDEIEEKKRDTLEKQILALAHNNPELTIIVSSRADERFGAWQAFPIFHVQRLEKGQVVDLIQKLSYDRIIKKKFIDRIRKDLYDKHKSFLSNPLLATMMLLTFDQFADIPEKIHLFYEQAFDTLFAKHDATKEAYKRRMYTDLSIDVFKKHFSYFCLATYYDEKFELSETECLAYIRKTLAVEGAEIEPPRFLKDLTESVCMLQRDGRALVFTHRSFQEFFAAYCLARTKKHLDEILRKILRRPTDNVVKMLHDMDQEFLEREFILPNLRETVAAISRIPEEKFVEGYCAYLGSAISVSKGDENYSLSHDRYTDSARFIDMLRALYPSTIKVPQEVLGKFHAQDRRTISKHSPVRMRDVDWGGRIKIDPDTYEVSWELQDRNNKSARFVDRINWLSNTGYAQWCKHEARALGTLLDEIESNQRSKNKAIDDLLGLATKKRKSTSS